MSGVVVGRSDIALLAKVRRPLVSMWPQRGARAGTPFPSPLPASGGRDLFDGDQIVDWLEATGLGNNPDARADLAAFGALAQAPRTEPLVLDGVTALLCLLAVHGRLPGDHDALLDLADETDPDDEYLYAEVAALDERLEALARYAVLLADAAYSVPAAFETLLAAEVRAVDGPRRRATLAEPARRFAASVALAVGADLDDPVYVDLSPGGSDLLVALAEAVDDRGRIVAALPPVDGAAGRLALRRLRVHDVVRRPLRRDEHGDVVLPAEAVALLTLPAPDQPDTATADLLRTVDELVLACPATVRVVVLAPAGALTDRLRDREAARLRGDLLRTDRVRVIARLPAGLRPGQARSRLGVWCLGPASAGDPTVVADLADSTVDDAATAAFATDVAAGMLGGRAIRAHAFRHGRPISAHALRARTGDLVGPQAVPAYSAPSADLLAQAADLTSRLGPLPPVAVAVTAADGRDGAATTTLGAAREALELSVLPGLRLHTDHLDAAGAVPLLGPEELAGVRPGRRADRLVLAEQYPHHTLTRPGDLVFCVSPRPMALVDRVGGAVVTFPAQVLRSRDARLLPDVMAADIAAQPSAARTWRGWTVRRVPTDWVPAVTALLDDLARQRDAAIDRLAALETLSTVLVDGIAAGVLVPDSTV